MQYFRSNRQSDVSYLTIKTLSHLQNVMEKREEGRNKYKEHVYNKMKPKWLFSQVASHMLEHFWIIWIDNNITQRIFQSNIQTLCTAGFDLYPF